MKIKREATLEYKEIFDGFECAIKVDGRRIATLNAKTSKKIEIKARQFCKRGSLVYKD